MVPKLRPVNIALSFMLYSTRINTTSLKILKILSSSKNFPFTSLMLSFGTFYPCMNSIYAIWYYHIIFSITHYVILYINILYIIYIYIIYNIY